MERAEAVRRSLGQAQVAVAEAAFRSGDRTAMVEALDAVPGDLRDQLWSYLSLKRNASLGPFRMLDGREVAAVAAVPEQPDCFALGYRTGGVEIVNAWTGESARRWQTAFSGDLVLGFSSDGSRLAVTAKGAPDILPGRAWETMAAVHGGAGLLATTKRIGSLPNVIKLSGTDGELPLRRELPVASFVARLAFDAAGARLLATLTNRPARMFATGTGEELLIILNPAMELPRMTRMKRMTRMEKTLGGRVVCCDGSPTG